MQYVYKYETGFIFKKVIYVGITNDLDRRHREHLAEHRLFRQSKLYYFKVFTRKKAKKIESYLIRKYRPILNKAESTSAAFQMFHLPFIWRPFKEGVDY